MTVDEGTSSWIDEITWSPSGPPWLAMGLTRIDEDRWLLPDHHRNAELEARRRLLALRHDEVFAAAQGTEGAGEEVLRLVRDWLRAHDIAWADAGAAEGAHPLELAGRLVQEDLVLMVPRDGGYHLDAAVLCFPSHWRLADKLGGSAAAIHGPVPRYEEELAGRVDRFLARLRPDNLVARRNWTVHTDDALFSPTRPAEPPVVPTSQIGNRLWLRSERQTLRRLPGSRAVLFTIRVQQAPFGVLAGMPRAAAALAARLRAQPAELTRMNGLSPYLASVLTWLDTATEKPVGGVDPRP